MSEKSCPICGSNNIHKEIEKRVFKDSLGEEVEINVTNYCCEDCESCGDFFKENNVAISKALELLNEKTVIKIINEVVKDNKIKMSRIERALGLSQRTLTKWRIGATKPTSSSVALFKFIKLFPFLIDIAEKDYNPIDADRILKNEVAYRFSNFNTVASIIHPECNAFLFYNSSEKKAVPISCYENPITNY